MNRFALLFFSVFSLLLFQACSTNPGAGINLFSPDQDMELGTQVNEQILSDPKQFPLLPENGNETAYRYVRGITTKLLNTGQVQYSDKFAWQVRIIADDKTLNAFCTPGGYIYVYTGLIKFLDAEHELAGVMGHEIAHAALRHSTRQMTQAYGIAALSSIITGKSSPGLIEQIAQGLLSLKFSRNHETEADHYSVVYLCSTDYDAAGAAGFFKKIAEKGGSVPEFLSTHPDPGNRIANIEANAKEMGCTGTVTNTAEYARIKSLLPNLPQ